MKKFAATILGTVFLTAAVAHAQDLIMGGCMKYNNQIVCPKTSSLPSSGKRAESTGPQTCEISSASGEQYMLTYDSQAKTVDIVTPGAGWILTFDPDSSDIHPDRYSKNYLFEGLILKANLYNGDAYITLFDPGADNTYFSENRSCSIDFNR